MSQSDNLNLGSSLCALKIKSENQPSETATACSPSRELWELLQTHELALVESDRVIQVKSQKVKGKNLDLFLLFTFYFLLSFPAVSYSRFTHAFTQ
jgi:hypothetical protein